MDISLLLYQVSHLLLAAAVFCRNNNNAHRVCRQETSTMTLMTQDENAQHFVVHFSTPQHFISAPQSETPEAKCEN